MIGECIEIMVVKEMVKDFDGCPNPTDKFCLFMKTDAVRDLYPVVWHGIRPSAWQVVRNL